MPKSQRRKALLSSQASAGGPKVSKYLTKLKRRLEEDAVPSTLPPKKIVVEIQTPVRPVLPLEPPFDDKAWHRGVVRSFDLSSHNGYIGVDGENYRLDRQVAKACQAETFADVGVKVSVRLRRQNGIIDIKSIRPTN